MDLLSDWIYDPIYSSDVIIGPSKNAGHCLYGVAQGIFLKSFFRAT